MWNQQTGVGKKGPKADWLQSAYVLPGVRLSGLVFMAGGMGASETTAIIPIRLEDACHGLQGIRLAIFIGSRGVELIVVCGICNREGPLPFYAGGKGRTAKILLRSVVGKLGDGGKLLGALHVWNFARNGLMRSSSFMETTMEWGRLIDHDLERLISTAQSLGVKVNGIINRGVRGQHIELCGSLLSRTKELCLD